MEIIKKKNKVLAHIIRNDHQCDGVDFITPDDYSQQVAYMHHPKGKEIVAHVHNAVHRSVLFTQEVLIIKKGKLRVDFYDEYEDYPQIENGVGMITSFTNEFGFFSEKFILFVV